MVEWQSTKRHQALRQVAVERSRGQTPAMLVGAGVRGGVVAGGFDEHFIGQAVDTGSGEVFEGGTLLTSANLGATLLAMADIDPGGVEPVSAVIL